MYLIIFMTLGWLHLNGAVSENKLGYVTVRNCVVYAFYYCDCLELKLCHLLARECNIGHLNAVKPKIK